MVASDLAVLEGVIYERDCREQANGTFVLIRRGSKKTGVSF